MAKIVLASASPRRQELLRRIGIEDFDIRVPQVEETFPEGLTPPEVVAHISREKADAAAALCAPEEIVITADTMVFLDEARLGKPRDEQDALRMLTALQGRRHTVCTGVTVRQGDRRLKIGRAHGQGRGLRRSGQGGATGGAAGRRFFQRNGTARHAAGPDAGAVRRHAFEMKVGFP